MSRLMKRSRRLHPVLVLSSDISAELDSLGCLQAHSCQVPLQKYLSGHPDIGQRKLGYELCCVLGQPAIANLGLCLDTIDLFMSKTAANREKDRVFNMALLQHGYVSPLDAIKMVDAMHLLSDADKKNMRARIRRWVKQLREQGYDVPSA